MTVVAIGIRIRTGRAIAVLLGGRRETPVVLDRREILLADPADAEARQPYHSGQGEAETSENKIRRRIEAVRAYATDSLAPVIADCQSAGTIAGAALVVGSDGDPNRIANPHIRAHALEGRLYRNVVEEALAHVAIRTTILPEKTAYAEAAKTLERSETDVKRAVTAVGEKTKPWRADEKLATAAAWMVLATYVPPE